MSRLAPLALLVLASAARPGLADEPPARQEDVMYGRKYGTVLTMDIFRPARPANGLGVIFVVSGGWSSNHAAINLGFVRPFTDRGYTVFAVVHASQPKFTIPEAIADINRSVRFIRHHAGDYGIAPDRLGICGASAGGHLSLMQGLAGDRGNPQATDPVEREPGRVGAVACFFPPTDFLNYGKPGQDAIGRGILKDYAAPFDFRDYDPKLKKYVEVADEAKLVERARAISPINHASADDPPTLIIHGDADTLVPIQQAEILVEKLKGVGVEAKLVVKAGAGHGWDLHKDFLTLADWFDVHLKAPEAPKGEATIPADRARDHVGERVTVDSTIRVSKDSERRREVYLDSEVDFNDEKNFAVVIPHDLLGAFKAAGVADPATHYRGKTIRVTGTIVREGTQVRIRVEEAGQVRVVD